MWQVLNRTDFAAAGSFARDADGHEVWCAALRASFDVAGDGSLRIAERQEPVVLMPRYDGEDNQILLADEDIIPFAPVTDILLHGVLEPAAATDRPLPLSLQIGALRKAAVLHPPRRARLEHGRWRLIDRQAQAPAPLGWDASFGGTLPDQPEDIPPENPLGCGIALRAPGSFAHGAETALPRIEGVGMDCAQAPQGSRAVGFGPMARWWRDRLALAGRFDAAWQRDRAPRMPADYDPRFLCAAPRDQWPEAHLSGGEPVALAGFTGTRDWAFRLPQALFRAETRIGTQLVTSTPHLARIDLWPAESRLSMLWLAALPCDGRDERIEATRLSLRQLSGVAP